MSRTFVNRWIPLIGLASDESVEVFESRTRGPAIERPHRTRLPRRHFMALAELRRRIAVSRRISAIVVIEFGRREV